MMLSGICGSSQGPMLALASAAATRSTTLRSAASLCHFLQAAKYEIQLFQTTLGARPAELQARMARSVNNAAAAAATRSTTLRSAASLCHFLHD
jgi:hypothetical protein